MALWDSEDCVAWARALADNSAVVAAQGVNGLVELDNWYRGELPGLLAERDPAYATLDELDKITSWKMKRGVWRERNRQLVAGNDPALTQQLTQQAFAATPDPKKPIALISKLAGVGPATASALLAAYRPDVYPFFDELIANQLPGLGPVAFTAPYYARYAEQLRQKAQALSGACSPRAWTAQDVGQALWSASGGKAVTSYSK